jgi:hypothetical protein
MSLRNLLSLYGAALWSFIFGILHALWASGIYVLLPADQAANAFAQRTFYIYNLVVVGACIIGVLLALFQSNVIIIKIPKSVIRFLGYSIVILLSLRGIGGVIHILYLISFEGKGLSPMALYDVWFCLGGLLFYLNLKPKQRQTVLF